MGQLYRMVGGTSGGNWKRPVNRMYSYNYQVGENYYLPMTSYLTSKNEGSSSDGPGPLCFSERIAVHPIVGEHVPEPDLQSVVTLKRTRQTLTSCSCSTHLVEHTSSSSYT